LTAFLLLGRELKPLSNKTPKGCNNTILDFGTPELKEDTKEDLNMQRKKAYIERYPSQKG